MAAMAEPSVLSPGQEEALIGLLRTLADAELVTEEARCRLCEVCTFDPKAAFACLQRSGRGTFNVHDLHAWVASQPHSVAGAPVEELAGFLLQWAPTGEVRLDDFLQIVLPRNPAHECLKRLALSRSSEVRRLSPEAAYHFCQLLENELEALRRLRFHRKAACEEGLHYAAALRFLDSEQGPCAGMGGLLSPDSVRLLLVDRIKALSRPQCDAFLRRVNPKCSSFFAFDELSRYLLEPEPPAHSASNSVPSTGREEQPSPAARYGYLKEPAAVALGTGASLGQAVGELMEGTTRISGVSFAEMSPGLYASPASRWVGEREREPHFSASHQYWGSLDATPGQAAVLQAPHLGTPTAPLRDVSGPSRPPVPKLPQAPWTSRARSPVPGLRDTVAGASPTTPLPAYLWPATSPGGGAGQWHSPTAVGKSYDRAQSPERRPYALGLGGSTSRPPLLRDPGSPVTSPPIYASPPPTATEPRRSTSVPPGSRAAATGTAVDGSYSHGASWAAHLSQVAATPPGHLLYKEEARERLSKAVLQTMARQGEVDAGLEDAKALLPPGCTLESAFATLDRLRKGFITAADMRALMEDFGAPLAATDFVGVAREVRLRWAWDDPAATALLIQERLSLRDLGLLVCPVGTPEYAAVREAASDDDLRSALYLLRNSEPCPKCSVRVQRDADAAGCPTVTCLVCGTSFKCFCVVGDPLPGSRDSGPVPLPPAGRYHFSRLLGAVVRMAGELERDRKKLALLLSYDACTLNDVFGHLAGIKAGISLIDLRRALFQLGPPLGERELGLLWHRYSPRSPPTSIAAILLPDFRRQLQPTAAWPAGP